MPRPRASSWTRAHEHGSRREPRGRRPPWHEDRSLTRPVGIEVFYWLDRWVDDQASVFDRVAAAGYDGAEISLIAGRRPDTAVFTKAADRAGIRLVCSTGLTPALDISSPDRAVRAAGREHLLRALDDAAALGSPILGGVTYAPWMVLHQQNRAEHRRRSAEVLHDVAEAAAAVGVDLCLEVLNRFETSLFNTVAECLAFIDMVGHPSVRVELDTFHMNIEEDDLAAAVAMAGERIGHVQVASNNRRPPQYGHIDWTAFRAALDRVGYTGWVVFETFPNPEVETGQSTRAWRPLAIDLDAEARQAAAFIRQHLS